MSNEEIAKLLSSEITYLKQRLKDADERISSMEEWAREESLEIEK